MQVVYFEELDSTNIEAQKTQYSNGDVIIADFQTQGRGQRGNVWSSERGKNLMFSIVLEPNVKIVEQFYISMLAAVAVMEGIKECGVECRIKWSNDLYVGDCKIGGILIEHNSMGEMITKSIIGVGINVSQIEFDNKLPNPTSLALQGCDMDKKMVLNCVLAKLEKWLAADRTALYNMFMSSLWRSGEVAKFFDVRKKEFFEATIFNVDPNTGEIELVDICNNARRYWFKEVEFVL